MIPEWRSRVFVITFFVQDLRPYAEIVSDLFYTLQPLLEISMALRES